MKLAAAFATLALACASARAAVLIQDAPAPDAFPLVTASAPASLFVDAADFKVVHIAAELFAADVERVTGKKPPLQRPGPEAAPGAPSAALFVGTLGKSPTIDALIRAKNIDTSAIAGQWESFLILPVRNPAPGIENGLAIIGSDRRGTAHGLMELSERIGVSPWQWWADVPAARRTALHIRTTSTTATASGPHIQGPPSVRYRGIFLNDEDWGLQPWAAKTIEPKESGGTGDIGPKTYAKIFELLLRLRANFCWPAMHDVTKAFNIYSENKQVADDYAIVMGSSHCEPMLRNNVTEWGNARARDYNYVTNRDGVLDYWRQRIQENGKFENVYTLGMRGIHDSDMAGGGTTPERAARLNTIMQDQRRLLQELVSPDVTNVPQIFCPYKEVLTLYQNGAVPPPDVTIVWADDNHGYIRQLSTPQEQARPGGAGVYYHISYWGRPHDYLWLSTLPPSLIWEELSKAYDYHARSLWVINVGDIKPAEIGLTLAMQMAYDHKRYTLDTIGVFLENFAAETFAAGARGHAPEIAAILRDYYRLNYQRKPEHLGWNYSQGPATPVQPMEFTDAEIHQRVAAFEDLLARAEALFEKLPSTLRDAYFQLVAYPVRAAALQNEKMLFAELNRRAAASRDWDDALRFENRSRQAFNRIAVETRTYNEVIAGGKWNHMMHAAPRNAEVFRVPRFAQLPDGTGANFDPFDDRPRPTPRPTVPPGNHAYAERSGYLSISAEHPTRNVPRNNIAWRAIPDLGRIGHSMAIFPTTAPSLDPEVLKQTAPLLEYDITTATPADAARICIHAIPTHRIHPGRGLRYAVAIDDEAPQVIDLETAEFSPTWSLNVLRSAAYGNTTHRISPGKHTLRLYMVDPGVVIDHLTIDLVPPPESPAGRGGEGAAAGQSSAGAPIARQGPGLPTSYLPPPETLQTP